MKLCLIIKIEVKFSFRLFYINGLFFDLLRLIFVHFVLVFQLLVRYLRSLIWMLANQLFWLVHLKNGLPFCSIYCQRSMACWLTNRRIKYPQSSFALFYRITVRREWIGPVKYCIASLWRTPSKWKWTASFILLLMVEDLELSLRTGQLLSHAKLHLAIKLIINN